MFQTGFGEEEVEHSSPKHQCDLNNTHSRPWQTPATAEATRPTALTSRWQSRPCVVWRGRIYSINRPWGTISRIHIEHSPLFCSQSQLSVLQGGKKKTIRARSKKHVHQYNLYELCAQPARPLRGRACTTWLCSLDEQVYSLMLRLGLRRICILIKSVFNQDGGELKKRRSSVLQLSALPSLIILYKHETEATYICVQNVTRSLP